MPKTIGEIKIRFEKRQRILFIILFISGFSTIIFGVICYFIPGWETVLEWSGFLGLGLGIFGGIGTFLTSRVRLQEINRKQENLDIIRPEYRQRSKKFVTNYISTPTQGILVVSLFIASGILIFVGTLNLLHWLSS